MLDRCLCAWCHNPEDITREHVVGDDSPVAPSSSSACAVAGHSSCVSASSITYRVERHHLTHVSDMCLLCQTMCVLFAAAASTSTHMPRGLGTGSMRNSPRCATRAHTRADVSSNGVAQSTHLGIVSATAPAKYSCMLQRRHSASHPCR